jgi:hypothetical protein
MVRATNRLRPSTKYEGPTATVERERPAIAITPHPRNRAVRLEHLRKVAVGHPVGQVADVQFPTYFFTLVEGSHSPHCGE